jgi:hypothetical protein
MIVARDGTQPTSEQLMKASGGLSATHCAARGKTAECEPGTLSVGQPQHIAAVRPIADLSGPTVNTVGSSTNFHVNK